VTAIAWGGLAIGAVLALGGVSGALDQPVKAGDAGILDVILDFPFTHPLVFAAMLETFAVTLILASLALLRLHRWGARVIEVAAWLGLLYLLGFVVFGAYLLIGLGFASDIAHRQPWFLPGFATVLVLNLGLLGTPLLLTVRYLRRHQVRAVLR
jgi:hypothetical protein